MRRRHHAEAGVEQPVKVFHIPIQGVRTLDSENAGDHRRIAPAPLEVVGQVRRGAQEHELAAGFCCHALEPPGLVECPFCQLGPGARWPALGQRQPDDCVARSLVAFNIQPARCLGDDGESLHRNVPFDEPGDVRVPARAPLEQVPSPKERVCVEVCDQQLPVKRSGLLRRRCSLRWHNAVEGALRGSWPNEEQDGESNEQE